MRRLFIAIAVLGCAVTALIAPRPALAQPSNFTFQVAAACDGPTGQYEITWTVNNWIREGLSMNAFKNPEQFRFLAQPGATETVVDSGVSIPGATGAVVQTYWGDEPGVGWLIQRVPGSAKEAELTFSPGYHGGTGSPYTITANLAGRCLIDGKPAVTFANECDGTITVKLSNTRPKSSPVTYDVRGSDSYHKSFQVAAGETRTLVVPARNASKLTVTTPTGKFGPVTWRQPAGCAIVVNNAPTASALPAVTASAAAISPAGSSSPTGAVQRIGAANRAGEADTSSGQALVVWLGVPAGAGLLAVLAVLLLLRNRRRRPVIQPPARPVRYGPPYGPGRPPQRW